MKAFDSACVMAGVVMLAMLDVDVARADDGSCPGMLYNDDGYMQYSGACNQAGTSGCYYFEPWSDYPVLLEVEDQKTYYKMTFNGSEWVISGTYNSSTACNSA